jgi:hypothetical protein
VLVVVDEGAAVYCFVRDHWILLLSHCREGGE